MVFESELLTFVTNNAIGVLFGILMYFMAKENISKNTEAIEKLAEAINNLRIK